MTTNLHYIDIIEDAARFIVFGLPPGGLTEAILREAPFDELRRRCHSMVDDATLLRTAKYIQKNSLRLFTSGLDSWCGLEESTPDLILLKIAGKIDLWVEHLGTIEGYRIEILNKVSGRIYESLSRYGTADQVLDWYFRDLIDAPTNA